MLDWSLGLSGTAALENVQITAQHQEEVWNHMDRAVLLTYRRCQQITYTLEIHGLAGKENPKLTAKMLLMYLAVARYIDEDIQVCPFTMHLLQGLSPAKWQLLLVNATGKPMGTEGQPIPDL